jgi:hypothetical protein
LAPGVNIGFSNSILKGREREREGERDREREGEKGREMSTLF